jgi:pimeloyl-ACP methyl ester carboxylesterase
MRTEMQLGDLHVTHALPDAPQIARPPLLLVHGANEGAWAWDNWLETLPSQGWEAFALSLRGHPGSQPMDPAAFCRLRIADYVDDVVAVSRYIGRPVVVVGHSMGGIVAQRFAEGAGAGGHAGISSPAALVLLASVAPGRPNPMREDPFPEDAPVHTDSEFHRPAPGLAERVAGLLIGESPSAINEYATGAGVRIDPAFVRCPNRVAGCGAR